MEKVKKIIEVIKSLMEKIHRIHQS